MNPHTFTPKKENRLSRLFIKKPIKKQNIRERTSFSPFINPLAVILTNKTAINTTSPLPNLPSIPQRLVFISTENIVDNK